jgi:hypothetical protein
MSDKLKRNFCGVDNFTTTQMNLFWFLFDKAFDRAVENRKNFDPTFLYKTGFFDREMYNSLLSQTGEAVNG